MKSKDYVYLLPIALTIGGIFYLLNQFLGAKSSPEIARNTGNHTAAISDVAIASPDKTENATPEILKLADIEAESIKYSKSVENVLSVLSGMSAQYSGLELSQQQIKYVNETASSRVLDTLELLQLAKVLHLSIPDNYLPAAWSAVFGVGVANPDFHVADLIADLPKGKLGEDMLKSAGASMAAMGCQPTQEDVTLLRRGTSMENFTEFMVQYASIAATYDPHKALEFAVLNRSDLGIYGLSNVIGNLKFTSDYQYVSQSSLIYDSKQNYSKEIVCSLASGWAAADPLKAAAWVDNIDVPTIRSNAAEALVSRWSTYDLKGASQWLATTNLRELDPAIGVLVSRLSRYSPNEARQWASLINNKEEKERLISNIEK